MASLVFQCLEPQFSQCVVRHDDQFFPTFEFQSSGFKQKPIKITGRSVEVDTASHQAVAEVVHHPGECFSANRDSLKS